MGIGKFGKYSDADIYKFTDFALHKVKRGPITMLAINYSTFRNNLKDYCNEASDNNQTIIVTRKKAKSIVIMSLDNYNQLMKSARNAEYLAKLDRSMEQIKNGFGQVHEEKNL